MAPGTDRRDGERGRQPAGDDGALEQPEFEPNYFLDQRVFQDPRGYLDRMRESGGARREHHHGAMMVTGYAEAMEVLSNRDGAFSSACSIIGPIPELPFTAKGDDFRDALERHRAELAWSDHLVSFDGTRHAEHRALLARVLTLKRLKQNEAYLQGFADRLLDRLLILNSCEILAEFSHATTVFAMSDLMGIPEDDRIGLLALLSKPRGRADSDDSRRLSPDPLIFLKVRFDEYLRQRRNHPVGDLFSDLAEARHEDGRLPDPAALSALARFLFMAGHDATSRLIAMAVLMLGEDTELQERLRRGDGRIADFVEEVLRYEPPVKAVHRLAVKHTTVSGRPVAPGDVVTVSLTAASNDPSYFNDSAAFDMDRPYKSEHLAFGLGEHVCVGAALGRMQAGVVIGRLLSRTSAIEIAERHHGRVGARHFRFEPTYTFRSLSDLHVILHPRG